MHGFESGLGEAISNFGPCPGLESGARLYTRFTVNKFVVSCKNFVGLHCVNLRLVEGFCFYTHVYIAFRFIRIFLLCSQVFGNRYKV